MQTIAIITRLCWKELRQAWIIPLLAVLLHVILYLSIKRNDANHQILFLSETAYILLFFSFVAIAIWSAKLAQEYRARNSYAGIHFSLHPALPPAITILTQGTLILLLGCSIGWGSAYWGRQSSLPLYATISGLIYSGIFVSSFSLTLVFSQWAGMVTGILWALINSATIDQIMNPVNSQLTNKFDNLAFAALAYPIAGALLILSIFIFTKLRMPLQRVFTVCVFLGCFIVPQILQVLVVNNKHQRFELLYSPHRITNYDGSLALSVERSKQKLSPTAILHFQDYLSAIDSTQHISKVVLPLGFIDRNTALLAQQKPGEREITILRWSLSENKLMPLLHVPAGIDSLFVMVEKNGVHDTHGMYVSPNGLYALLTVSAKYPGDGYSEIFDLWLIDIQQRKAILLKPAMKTDFENYLSIAWQQHNAIISNGSPQAFYVNPASGIITPLKFPTGTGDAK